MTVLDREAVAAIESCTDAAPLSTKPLSGGCIAEVYRVDLSSGDSVVLKRAAEGGLDTEAFMLSYLASHTALPVPGVLHASDSLLLLEFVESSPAPSPRCETHAADLLAALHGIGNPTYGFERDTLIGPLPQPNPQSEDWCGFFRDHRLLHFGRLALDAGSLPRESFARLERLAAKLESYIDSPQAPSLIHGDIWSGNVLYGPEGIAAFLDPAIYFADAEIELAYITLFSTFGPAFFRHYNKLRPIAPGFTEVRRDLYCLYPLLVHTRLFGGAYARQVDAILTRLA